MHTWSANNVFTKAIKFLVKYNLMYFFFNVKYKPNLNSV